MMMTWVRRVGLCSVLLLSFSHDVFAGQNNGWFVGVDAGSVWPNLKSNTTVFNGNPVAAPNNADSYTIRKHPSATAAGALSFGYHFIRTDKIFPCYSLAARYQHISRFKIQGVIEQYSLPDFANYNYYFNLASNIFTLQSKFDIYQFEKFAPYMSVGVGIASNDLWGYHEQATANVIPRVSPAFQDNTTNNVTFNVGIGLGFQLNQAWSATLGYEFANLGKVKSHAGSGDNWAGESIAFGTLTTQAVLFSVNYQL